MILLDKNNSETFQTYDYVSSGTYVCLQCGGQSQKGIITVKQGEMLPECKECGYTYWIKVM